MPNDAMIRPIHIVATLMIIFGLAEIVTGFTHNFLGIISVDSGVLSTCAAAGIGALYAAAGQLIFTLRKRAAALALACLAVVVGERVAVVLTGLYAVDSSLQIFAIVTGTGIAIMFAAYIIWKWKLFR